MTERELQIIENHKKALNAHTAALKSLENTIETFTELKNGGHMSLESAIRALAAIAERNYEAAKIADKASQRSEDAANTMSRAAGRL